MKPQLATLILALVAVRLCAGQARYETTSVTNGVADIAIADYETGQMDDHKDGIQYPLC